ncbi:MAG TPA: acetyltransferase [Agitococcus sp.]|nr:acetyltransferase [Agitococcus sp.]HRH91234.1 acetyltransferase [Agitococcus sp.]
MSRLVILGAGGHGSVVADAAKLQKKWSEIVFLDDAWPKKKEFYDWPIQGKLDQFIDYVDHQSEFIVAIGNAKVRYTWLTKLISSSADIGIVIHPSAVVSDYALIDRGAVIFANAVINIGASIGLGSIVNTSATVDHDVKLAICVHVCPGVNIAGGVVVGDFTWIGIGSAVKQMVSIGSNVVIGAGAAVISDIPDNVKIVGVPAKVK